MLKRSEGMRLIYDGLWSDGRMHGQGRAVWSGIDSGFEEEQARHSEDEVENVQRKIVQKESVQKESVQKECEHQRKSDKRCVNGVIPSQIPSQILSQIPSQPSQPKLPLPPLPSQRTCYVGQWTRGLRHGEGRLTTLSDKGEIIGVTVDGKFVRGRIHGSATLLYPDGAKYSGNILRGTPNGTGEMSWSDGSSFKGKW